MNKALAIWLTGALLVSPLTAFSKEIFRDVQAVKRDRIVEYNKGNLDELLYFSRRHRIVSIDTKSLLKSDKKRVLNFNLVGEISAKVVPGKIKRLENGALEWVGHQNIPQLREMLEIHFQGQVGIDLNALETSHSRVSLFLSQWSGLEDGTAKRSNDIEDKSTGMKQKKLDAKPVSGKEFYSVYGALKVGMGGPTYFIRPLDNTPRYHVIYEFYPEDAYPVSYETPKNSERELSESQVNRREKHLEHLKGIDKKAKRILEDI